MKTTFNSPIINIPIEIHYSSFEEFSKYYLSQTGRAFEGETNNGLAVTFTKDYKEKIVVWIKEKEDEYVIETVAHETFHIVCKLRRMMYDLEYNDNLTVCSQNEEDWAYMYGEIFYNIHRMIDSWSKEPKIKRELNAKKKEQTSAEDK